MQSAPALSTQVTNCAVLRIHTTPNRKKHRVPQGQATPIRTESGSARSRRHPACGYRLPDAQTRCPRLRRPLSSCGRLRMVQTKSSYRKRRLPNMAPSSSLDAGLIPTAPLRQITPKQMLPSSLGSNLVSQAQTRPIASKAGLVSQLRNDLAPPSVCDSPAAAPVATSTPGSSSYMAHVEYFREQRRQQINPNEPPQPPLGGGFSPAHCFYTGDDLVPPEGGPGSSHQISTRHAQPKTCIYTGDDLPVPPSRPKAAPPPTTPREVWLPSSPSPDVRRLHEWKSRYSMPEVLDAIPGFPRAAIHRKGAKPDADWVEEGKARAGLDAADAKRAQAVRDQAAQEIHNVAQNQWGSRLPARGKGELFAPYANRS